MKPAYIVSAFLVTLLLVAVLTNPSPERHKEAIQKEVAAFIQESLPNEVDNEWEKLGRAIGASLTAKLIESLIDNLISVDNYLIFSVSMITFDEQSKVIAIGAFGNVRLTKRLKEVLINKKALEDFLK